MGPTSAARLDDDDDEKQPFEYEAAAQPAQPARKRGAPAASRQSSILAFTTKSNPNASDSDDDDDDDDDDDGLVFNFSKHKQQKTETKESKFKSTYEDISDRDAKKKGERKLLKHRRYGVRGSGQSPLPPGWEARCYVSSAGGKEYWIFSHPLQGETNSYERTKYNSTAEYEEAQKRRKSAGAAEVASSSDGWFKKKRLGGGAANDAAESGLGGGGDEDGDPQHEMAKAGSNADSDSGGGDDLSALLLGRKRKSEAEEAMRERVQEEMSVRMDTGVRVNPLLKQLTDKLKG